MFRDISTYPGFVYYISWFVASDQFRPLSLVVLEAAFSPGVAAFVGFAAQAKPVRFESAGTSALHTPSFLVLIQGTQGIGV